MQSEVVCDGIRFGEGPVWCGDDTLVVTSVVDGALYRVDVGTGEVTLFADVGGGGERRGDRRRRLGRRDPERRHRLLRLRPVRRPATVQDRPARPATRRARRLGHLPRRSGLPRAERRGDRCRRSRVLHRSRPLPAARTADRPRDGPRARRPGRGRGPRLLVLQRNRVHPRRDARRDRRAGTPGRARRAASGNGSSSTSEPVGAMASAWTPPAGTTSRRPSNTASASSIPTGRSSTSSPSTATGSRRTAASADRSSARSSPPTRSPATSWPGRGFRPGTAAPALARSRRDPT